MNCMTAAKCWLALLALVTCFGPPTAASAQITTSLITTFPQGYVVDTVTASVYDAAAKKNQVGSWVYTSRNPLTSGTLFRPFGLTIQDHVVFWSEWELAFIESGFVHSSGTYTDAASFATYDPAIRTWQRDRFSLEQYATMLNYFPSISSVVSNSGVVAAMGLLQQSAAVNYPCKNYYIYLATYDASLRQWAKKEVPFLGSASSPTITGALLCKGGIVCWGTSLTSNGGYLSGQYGFYAAIYDTRIRQWVVGSKQYRSSNAYQGTSVQNSVASLATAEGKYTLTFDAKTHQWR